VLSEHADSTLRGTSGSMAWCAVTLLRELWDRPSSASIACAGVRGFRGHANTLRQHIGRVKIAAVSNVTDTLVVP
jgi:hypothetical protein